MAKSLKDRLIQALVENNLITQKNIEKARNLQVKDGGSLGRILIKEGMVSEKDLMSAMSKELNMPAINLLKYKIALSSCRHPLPDPNESI